MNNMTTTNLRSWRQRWLDLQEKYGGVCSSNNNTDDNNTNRDEPAIMQDEIESSDELDLMDTPRSSVLYSIDDDSISESSSESQESELQKNKKNIIVKSFHEFIIRPLVMDDYGPKLLKFLGWFDLEKTKSLTPMLFAQVLIERKRKQHYTFAAILTETNEIVSIGSFIIIDNLFSPNLTAYIDSILIHPEFQGTALKSKMIARLHEVAEMIPFVCNIKL